MFTDPLPGGYNAHLYSHVLHDWDAERVEHLLASSFAALPAGGWLLDHDTHIDADKRGPPPTPKQVERVLRAIREDRDRRARHLALSGLRRGEISGLRWTNIDFDAKTLTMGPTRISAAGKAVEQDSAKSEDSRPVRFHQH